MSSSSGGETTNDNEGNNFGGQQEERQVSTVPLFSCSREGVDWDRDFRRDAGTHH
jgi:hypothetical protein